MYMYSAKQNEALVSAGVSRPYRNTNANNKSTSLFLFLVLREIEKVNSINN